MCKNNHNKKSQMEIVGLALIVVLVGLVLLFAVQYTFKKPQQTIQKAKEKTTAENFLSAMLKTNTLCQKRTIGELIQDCALARMMDCGNSQDSCLNAKTTIQYLLENTIKKWNKQYRFIIDGAENTNSLHFESSTTACKGEKASATRPFTITAGFDVTIKLDIC